MDSYRAPHHPGPGGVLLAFSVNGQPRSQGSKRLVPTRKAYAFYRDLIDRVETGYRVTRADLELLRPGSLLVSSMIESSDAKLRKWRKAIVAAARMVRFDVPLDEPLELGARFLFPRPKSHLKKNGGLTARAPLGKISKPDNSKIVRPLEDAMTDARIWVDDSRVVGYRNVVKDWTTDASEIGVAVIVYAWKGY